jgi:Tol biopolymer transport system component
MAGGMAGEVSYVYFKPGTFSDEADEAEIENLETRLSQWTRVVYGGIDPVPIAAEVGDSLEVSVYDRDIGDGVLLSRVRMGVPVARMPEVVRAEPARGRTAVPINRNVKVVFSEPVEPSTITPQSVQLRVAGQLVSAVLELQVDGFTVELQPAPLLQANTEYEIVVSDEVLDLAGQPLEAPFTSHFTTGSSTSTIYMQRLTQDIDQVGTWMGGIWAVNPDGTGLRPIIWNEADNFRYWDVDVSPDGRRLAVAIAGPVTGFIPEDIDIYLMDSDGRNWIQLTSGRVTHDVAPSWSPDGGRIAFTSEGHVFVINTDGSGLIDLGPGHDPDWSPDGDQIVFAECNLDAPIGLVDCWTSVMSASGSGRTLLADNAYSARWSPDGGRIAFVRRTGGVICIANQTDGTGPTQTEIFVMNADGTDVTQLTRDDPPFGNELYRNKGPIAWSPDGTRLAHGQGYRAMDYPGCGAMRIAVMNADGGGHRLVTGVSGAHDGDFSWGR